MANLNHKNILQNPSGTSCFATRTGFRTEHHFKRHFMGNTPNNIFPTLEDNLLPRQPESLGKHLPGNGHVSGGVHLKHEMIYGHHPSMNATHPTHIESLDLIEPLCSPSLPPLPPESTNGQMRNSFYPHSMGTMASQQTIHGHNIHHNHHPYRGGLSSHNFERVQNDDIDPRELEAFAERFKQRRIKLGVTQADVGRALVHLKLPGVGTLSQSTICRFESLTLSRNNMLALKPVLHSWLEAAECQARGKKRDTPFVLPPSDKKRKRTSIAALEKRSLEAYFAVQQRPSGDKIASIAEKLDLKKSVVRVWFCNQRQKQKRMKYSANQGVN
ncbi:inhibitory POU protein [Trichonephila inaurata madagascariensis]|uniref:POU domain protein n=1 Tax=Trichonephila inaurata madagascariensis TaxID=2747483 RepID=A0A8X6Y1U3_9ARAC|nr:inhibitory POU protein [Trichonephila inaurata madagascariensis]